MGLFTISTLGEETTLYKDGKPVGKYLKSGTPNTRRMRTPPKTDPSVFVGPKLKVERAKRHIQDLEIAINAFHNSDPYGLIGEIDPKTGENVCRVLVKKGVPIAFSGIIGDVVHNLRAALDGLVCDLVRANTKCDTFSNGFPIREGTKRLKPGTVTKIKGVSPKAERLILRMIYRDGWNDPMWQLHWFDIIDKHNRIVAIATAVVQINALVGIPGMFVGPDGNLRLLGPGPGGVPFMADGGSPANFRKIFPVENNVEIHRSPAGFNENIKVTFDVAFSESRVGNGEPVVETLKQLAHLVERTLWVFERHVA